jgi:hypothetical protein
LREILGGRLDAAGARRLHDTAIGADQIERHLDVIHRLNLMFPAGHDLPSHHKSSRVGPANVGKISAKSAAGGGSGHTLPAGRLPGCAGRGRGSRNAHRTVISVPAQSDETPPAWPCISAGRRAFSPDQPITQRDRIASLRPLANLSSQCGLTNIEARKQGLAMLLAVGADRGAIIGAT